MMIYVIFCVFLIPIYWIFSIHSTRISNAHKRMDILLKIIDEKD